MSPVQVIIPFFGMMLLTFVVWIVMFLRRVQHIRAQRIKPSRLKTPEQLQALMSDKANAASNNLKNLFELPVIFYVLVLYLYVTNSVDLAFLIAAWTFFVFRCLHSLVHCTVNDVMARFRLYALSSIALWFMVGKAALQLAL
jgi:hypothetical protein